jgi:hypothetical protein
VIERHVRVGGNDLTEEGRKYLAEKLSAPGRLMDKRGAFAEQEQIPVSLSRIAEPQCVKQ